MSVFSMGGAERTKRYVGLDMMYSGAGWEFFATEPSHCPLHLYLNFPSFLPDQSCFVLPACCAPA